MRTSMIDEYWTWIFYGYYSDELSLRSGKPIVVQCDMCYKYRVLSPHTYNDLCLGCSMIGMKHSEEHIRKFSEARMGHVVTEDTRRKISQAHKGKTLSKKTKQKMSVAKKTHPPLLGKHLSDETKRKLSELNTGANHPNWQGGISIGKYCPKFNNVIKQYIRDKYNNCDYISGIHKDVCNPKGELDVHHVDYNKEQGCDDHEWRLIPLSRSHHIKTNFNRDFWNRLFTYSLQYDENYQENCIVDIWRTL